MHERLQPPKGPSVTRRVALREAASAASTAQGSVCNSASAYWDGFVTKASTAQGSVCNHARFPGHSLSRARFHFTVFVDQQYPCNPRGVDENMVLLSYAVATTC